MSGPIYLNLAERVAVLGDLREVPITVLYDIYGDETTEADEAVALVCGEGMEFYSVDLSSFDRARIQ